MDRSDPRWLVASGALGAMWLAWDVLVAQVFEPMADWFSGLFTDSAVGDSPANLRPTLEDTIRLLEGHLQRGASRQVDINAALRLAEIYQTVKHDPANAQRVIATARARYPDAEELKDSEE